MKVFTNDQRISNSHETVGRAVFYTATTIAAGFSIFALQISRQQFFWIIYSFCIDGFFFRFLNFVTISIKIF